MRIPAENILKTVIDNSGNSDVDLVVNIDIETKAIAYGLICSLYAKGDLDDLQLEKAIDKLDSLIERDKKRDQLNQNKVIESKPKLNDYPQSNKRRRSWL
ncbi:hypothetical protein CJ195_26165 [Bacillus sp. UMB0899]|uniref:hypothetical protein n=1 Tax=Metabacillus schmidteae TaxID=2730405 RepID=UPI000C80DA16|nr:hypothetical protein [Metabacillus schmidteae]PMC33905.1 hypothetical protein CJ195_26165 [Bacillus sp. UMB0899]